MTEDYYSKSNGNQEETIISCKDSQMKVYSQPDCRMTPSISIGGVFIFGGVRFILYLCCSTNPKYMFDKLIDFIISLGQDILPFTIVNQWEKGVHLRFGKYTKIVEPGIAFKIPFFDKIWTHDVITQTVNLQPQTLTTQDEKAIVLKSIVRYHIHDIRKFLLMVMHASDVLVDTTQGIIRDIVERTDWNDLVDVNEEITEEVRIAVEGWGITIEKVTLTDLGIIRTIRLMSDNQRQVATSLGMNGL